MFSRTVLGTSRRVLCRSLSTAAEGNAVRQLSGSNVDPNDITLQVQDVPQVSGSGSFIQEPKFTVIGHPAAMVHITLPASGSIFTRRGSIIGVNGSLSDITSTLTINQPLKELAATKPVLYQHVSSTSPVTLLVADNSNKSSLNRYTIIDVGKSTPWTIGQRRAVLGWNSTSLNVEAKRSGHLWKHWGNVRVSGSGQLVLIGEGDLFQIEVGSGEEVLLNPTNVIAYSEPPSATDTPTITKLPHLKSYIELPTVISDWIENHKLVQSISSWAKSITTRLLWRDDVTLKLKGPRTIIIQNQGTKLDHLFTKQEIKDRIVNN